LDEAIEEQLVDVLGGLVGADARIEIRRAAFDQEDKRVRVAGRGATGGEKQSGR
jgi:hypothetical protein